MRIIVDANIVFSAILKSDSKVGDLLINSNGIFKFITTDFLRIEIQKHHDKLMRISKLTMEQILESEYQIYKSINFIADEQIGKVAWDFAKKLVQEIDAKDIAYVAFSKQFKAKLWSGDKKLKMGLSQKGFTNFISTSELWDVRQVRIKRSY